MDSIQLLTTRSSTPRLQAPGPSPEHWQIIQKAAVRAPDHAGLRPWQFVVFDNEQSQQALGEMFAAAAKAQDPDIDQMALDKAKGKPKRAPMVIACIAKVKDHPKVPRVEQVVSAGCSVMAMQQAAFALGYGGVWRTGPFAHNPHMKDQLGLNAEDEIVGYLYLGTPIADVVIKPEKPIDEHFVQYQA